MRRVLGRRVVPPAAAVLLPAPAPAPEFESESEALVVVIAAGAAAVVVVLAASWSSWAAAAVVVVWALVSAVVAAGAAAAVVVVAEDEDEESPDSGSAATAAPTPTAGELSEAESDEGVEEDEEAEEDEDESPSEESEELSRKAGWSARREREPGVTEGVEEADEDEPEGMLEIVQACLPPPTLVSTYNAVQREGVLTLLRGIPRANNIAVVVSDLVTVVRQVRSAGAFRAVPGSSNRELVRGAEGLAGGLGEVVGGGDGQGVRAGILVAAGGGSQRGHREEEERVFHFAGIVEVVSKERMTERYISK